MEFLESLLRLAKQMLSQLSYTPTGNVLIIKDSFRERSSVCRRVAPKASGESIR
jgi:hypothetical protein